MMAAKDNLVAVKKQDLIDQRNQELQNSRDEAERLIDVILKRCKVKIGKEPIYISERDVHYTLKTDNEEDLAYLTAHYADWDITTQVLDGEKWFVFS